VSGASFKHYYESFASFMLTNDQPASTYATMTAIDNTLHLVDSSPVYRVNWVDNVGISIPTAIILPGVQIGGFTVIHQFPTTVYKEWVYPNYDIRVATSITSSDLFVYAAITNPHASGSSSDPNILGSLLATASNTSPAWSIDGTISTTSGNRSDNTGLLSEGLINTEIAIDHVGHSGVGSVVWAQLQVSLFAEWTPDSPDNHAYLYGIQVREYVNDD
jgi:hypothetical protein